MSEVLSQKEVEAVIRNRILEDSKKFRGFSLKYIVFQKFDVDTWGNLPIYKVEGHIEVSVKTGVLSSKPGRKGFSAKVDARNGKIVAFNWLPGEPVK
jgi:hypothetical protein